MNFRQNGDKYLIIIEVIALIVVLVFGAVHFVMPGNKANKKITESQQETQNPTQETDGIQQVQADGQQAATGIYSVRFCQDKAVFYDNRGKGSPAIHYET